MKTDTKYGNDRSPEALAFLAEVADVSRRHGFVFWIETWDCVVVTKSRPVDGPSDSGPTIEGQNSTPELVEVVE